MIVCVLSLGSYWEEPKDGRPVIWNTTAVVDQNALRPRSKVYGQVRFDSRLYNQALSSRDIVGSRWHSSALDTHAGIRKLMLLRRAARGSESERFLVAVTDVLVGTLDDASWDPAVTSVVSFSEWRERQEALLLMPRFGWLRGSQGSAALTPGAPDGDWFIRRW